MIDLKGPYDMVNAAEAALQKQAAEIADLLALGTDEATQSALALQESLDTLQADYNGKKALYAKLVQANQPSDVAAMFVPASPTATEEEKKDSVMTLAEFNAMTPRDRLAFANRGGKIQEKED